MRDIRKLREVVCREGGEGSRRKKSGKISVGADGGGRGRRMERNGEEERRG